MRGAFAGVTHLRAVTQRRPEVWPPYGLSFMSLVGEGFIPPVRFSIAAHGHGAVKTAPYRTTMHYLLFHQNLNHGFSHMVAAGCFAAGLVQLTGEEDDKPSLSQLAEQSARVGGVYLIYLVAQSNGRSIAISDAVWGLVLGEFAGMLVSLSFIGFGACKGNIRKTTWSLLTMSFPLTLNRLTLNLFTTIENLLIPYQLKLFGYSSSDALSIYGILTGMAFAIIMFPTVLTNSISVLLLPVVSEAQAKHNDRLIREAIIKTTESCLLLGLLCTIGLLVLGDFIGNFIFKNALSATFIVTMSWICPFLYLGSTLNSIFHGLGKPGITLFLNLFSCLIRILFIIFLIPVIGIKGYLTGLLISQIALCVLALLWLYRLMKKGSSG